MSTELPSSSSARLQHLESVPFQKMGGGLNNPKTWVSDIDISKPKGMFDDDGDIFLFTGVMPHVFVLPWRMFCLNSASLRATTDNWGF